MLAFVALFKSRYLGAMIVLSFIFPCVIALDKDKAVDYGAESNPTGFPIGGGPGYPLKIRESRMVRVATKGELLAALKKARSGSVIYVDDKSEIDLTGERDIVIPKGVTLASGRGQDGSSGGLLFTTEDKKTSDANKERFSLFITGGPKVRVTGIRLRGPDALSRGRYDYLNSDGIQGMHDRLEVDNCEIWAWSHGGVFVKKGKKVHVHHNFIHHCQRRGLGYCVVIDEAMVLIEANLFDHYRHAIAGTGRSPSGYEARYNISGPNSIGHVFDMHGGRDRKDGTHVAGDVILIHHNTFQSTHQDFIIRGVPTKTCEIHHNWFVKKTGADKAILQKNAKGKLVIGKNAYGAEKTVK